jgi:hypothetical protein
MATIVGPPTREQYEIAKAPPRDAVEVVGAVEEERPAESHALVNGDHDEKGAAQHDHGEMKPETWAETRNQRRFLSWGSSPNEKLDFDKTLQ